MGEGNEWKKKRMSKQQLYSYRYYLLVFVQIGIVRKEYSSSGEGDTRECTEGYHRVECSSTGIVGGKSVLCSKKHATPARQRWISQRNEAFSSLAD